jgi:type IV pilus assembly protein PilO
MKLDDFNNIDFKNMGSLPMPVKLVLLALMFLALVGVGYYLLWSDQISEFEQAQAKEQDLRKVFADKKSQAVKIDAYRQQMADIEKTFGAVLKQLPDKSQMDGLLGDINKAGSDRKLEFELFKPGNETVSEFYAEKPIQIKVVGNYHDMGAFATDISKLPRIVTLNDLSITPVNATAKDSPLVLEAVAKTYRYLDASETAAKKEAEKKVVKKKAAK